jgi:hypothetical protein
MTKRLTPLLCALALAAAGCGGDDGGEEVDVPEGSGDESGAPAQQEDPPAPGGVVVLRLKG